MQRSVTSSRPNTDNEDVEKLIGDFRQITRGLCEWAPIGRCIINPLPSADADWERDRGIALTFGLYKPRTGRCMNHPSAILAAPALIYSTHRLLVVWIIVAHFHLYSLLDRYTVLEVSAVRRPMRVCCGSRWGRCVLFINIWDSLVAPLLGV